MTVFSKKEKIRKLAEEAEAYAASACAKTKADGYAKSGGNSSVPDIRYSLRDSYDSDSVKRLMTNISEPGDPAYILKGLELNRNSTFVDCMVDHIGRKKMRDSAVYKAAKLDRRLFSKMISDREYKPAKDTALAIVFALQLTVSEAEDMLSRAGYTLSHSSKRDIIIEYLLREEIYDLNDINAVLFKLGQKTIGR